MITLRCGHGAVGDGVDHHRAVLDDPALLVLLADHVAGGVVQEEQRGVGLVGELDELGRLLRLLGEQHALGVGEDADRAAVQLRPPGDERGAVERLELVERPAVALARPVDDPQDHLARVERLLEVRRDQVEQALGVGVGLGEAGPWSPRISGDFALRRAESPGREAGSPAAKRRLPAVQPGDDPPPDPDRVVLVLGEVVGEAGDPGVHLGAAERLVVGLLAGRHLHQRRAAEEDLRAAADEDGVVAHAGDVRPAGGRVAEDQRDRRLPPRGGAGQVAEEATAGDEDLLLRRQVRAARLDEGDRREVVLLGDLRGAEDLLHRPRVGGAALDGGVVGADQALHALDDTDAGDDGRADGEVRAPARPAATAPGRPTRGRGAARSARARSACRGRGGGRRTSPRRPPPRPRAGRRGRRASPASPRGSRVMHSRPPPSSARASSACRDGSSGGGADRAPASRGGSAGWGRGGSTP